MIHAIIQARTGSTRLPGKVLFDLCGKNVLERVIERVEKSSLIDQITVATTTNKEDDAIEQLFLNKNVSIFRGSEKDVLDRFYQCCINRKMNDKDTVVRITADCPLIDWHIIDDVIKLCTQRDYDYASNTLIPTFPDGMDVEAFTFSALKLAWENSCLSSEREHVTPYIKKHTELFNIKNFAHDCDNSDIRLTIDEKEDYELIKKIYAEMIEKKKDYICSEIIEFLLLNEELKSMNSMYLRNEGYIKSLAEDTILAKGELK